MVSIYTLENTRNKRKCDFNELALLNTIKALKPRNLALAKSLIEIWEILEDKKFDDKIIK